MLAHFEKHVQIQIIAYVGALLFNKASSIVSTKYSHYNNVFLAKNIIKFLKYIRINNHTIK